MAVRLDASGDALTLSTGVFSHNSAYTWMGWVRFTNLGSWEAAFCIGSNRSDVLAVDFAGKNDSNQWALGANNNTTYQNLEAGSVSTGTWYHMAIVRSSTSNVVMYINGAVMITNGNSVAGRTASSRIDIGRSSSSNGDAMNGRIFGMKAWTTNLSQAQVQQEMNLIRPVNTTSLWGWWPVFAGATERARDYSGNARNWTESGTLTDEDPPPVSWGAGPIVVPSTATSPPSGIDLSLRSAIIELAGVSPSLSLSGVSLDAGVAPVDVAGISPSVALGEVALFAEPAAFGVAGVSASLALGGVSLNADPALVDVAGVSPALALGGVAADLQPALINVLGVSPAIALGGLELTPAPAVVNVAGISPELTIGNVTLVLTPAAIDIAGISPVIDTGGTVLQAISARVDVAGISPSIAIDGVEIGLSPAYLEIAGVSPSLSGSLGLALDPALVDVAGISPAITLAGAMLPAGPAVVELVGISPQVAAEGTLGLSLQPGVVLIVAVSPGLIAGELTVIGYVTIADAANTITVSDASNSVTMSDASRTITIVEEPAR